jgi:hypothetical protein
MSDPRQPPLRLPYSEETLTSHAGYTYWERRSSEDIIESLQPDAESPLTVGPDGTVLQGNTRVYILRQRGFDVNSLPRTPHSPISGRFPTDD